MLSPSRRAQGHKPGFTIVELLIVIVVIAVLAAISIVAYTGIQAQARDAAIRSDLNSFAKLAEMYRVENGRYPDANTPALSKLGFKASIGAYPDEWWLSYCLNSTDQNKQYILVAFDTQGGDGYYVSSNNSSPAKVTTTACYSDEPQGAANDAGLNGIDVGVGGRNHDGTWRDWVK